MSYSAYMLLSVLGWTRAKREMDKAIKGSREKLLDEPEKKRHIFGGALDILYSYYVRQANLHRVWTSVASGILGLMFSLLALRLGRAIFNTVAYAIFILSIVALEGGFFALSWQFKLYAQVRPFETAQHDLEHPKHHKRGRRNQPDSADSDTKEVARNEKTADYLGCNAAASGIAAILGFMNVQAGNASGFCPWFWWMGIFTWDDALIIGAFLFITTAVVALKRGLSTHHPDLFFLRSHENGHRGALQPQRSVLPHHATMGSESPWICSIFPSQTCRIVCCSTGVLYRALCCSGYGFHFIPETISEELKFQAAVGGGWHRS